jgi:Glycosyl transferases group 1
VKLFFLGRGHPNPLVPTMAMYERAVALAKELNLHNRVVFFNEGWVPHAQRANYLLEADIGVSAHLELVEARFAFRTRLLDYIWADLPMVISAGDTLAEMVREQGLGLVVAIGDHEGFARALLALADERDAGGTRAGAFAAARADCAWGKVLRPLIDFCRRPRFAADRGFADPEVARLRNDLEAARDEALHLLSEFRQARDYAMRLEARVGELERAHEQVAASARTLDRQLRAANPIKNRLRTVLRA